MSAFSRLAEAVELHRAGLLGEQETEELFRTLGNLGYSIEDLP